MMAQTLPLGALYAFSSANACARISRTIQSCFSTFIRIPFYDSMHPLRWLVDASCSTNYTSVTVAWALSMRFQE